MHFGSPGSPHGSVIENPKWSLFFEPTFSHFAENIGRKKPFPWEGLSLSQKTMNKNANLLPHKKGGNERRQEISYLGVFPLFFGGGLFFGFLKKSRGDCILFHGKGGLNLGSVQFSFVSF